MASRKIGALWVRKSQDGKSFLSGVLQDLSGDIQIAVFKNDRKEQDNHPDYNIVLSGQKKEQTAQQDDFIGGEAEAVNSAPAGEEEIKVENIPF